MDDLQKYHEYLVEEGPLCLEDIKILTGANYFSGGPVVRMRINLGAYDEVFTNVIPGFFERLKAALPSLEEHHCSLGKAGGFFDRVKEGTLLGHVIEHVSIEMQTLAGMDAGFGKTRITKKQGVYNVVFRFLDEVAGMFAGKAAINLINSILTEKEFDVKFVHESLIFIREERLLGFSTQAIVNMADRKQIPWIRLDKYNLVQLGTGKYRKIIRATMTENASLLAVEITDNKYRTSQILDELGVPVPQCIITQKQEDALAFKHLLAAPIVIKPADGYQGKRVSMNLTDNEQIADAFQFAREFCEDVIVQEYCPGNTFRILVIGHQFAAAVRLQPPVVTGDGRKTIQELINEINSDPAREFGDKGKLSRIELDENTLKILEQKGLTASSILESGKTVVLKNSGNTRLGGQSFDVTEEVDPFNKFMCERISKILNLDVAGIDILSPDISKPVSVNNGKVIQVSAAPDFRMHINPTIGVSREVQEKFIEMLFPHQTLSRIPLISVTGSRGKSLAVELLSYCFTQSGLQCGVVSSQGLIVSGHCISDKDMTNSRNAQIILKDPSIDCAIIETPVETILNFGLGYKYASIGIVLNLHEDREEYYQFDHIKDIIDIAYAKSVVAEEVYSDGFTILNADQELVAEIHERLYSKPFFFSRKKDNPLVLTHRAKGGLAVLLDEGKIFVQEGPKQKLIAETKDLVILQNATEDHMIDCVLAVVATLHAWGKNEKEIYYLLRDFKAGSAN
jgi:cyanophycin synthetase